MKVSTRARYGARALVEIALVYPDGTVSIRDIAERQKISPKYLNHIMGSLRAAGLVTAVRGVHGGYALARSPADITLKDLFEAIEGSVAPVDCVDHPGECSMEDICPTRDTWIEMKEAMENILDETTIQKLVDRRKRKEDLRMPIYQI